VTGLLKVLGSLDRGMDGTFYLDEEVYEVCFLESMQLHSCET
jgi:hypothetical protein